MSTRMTTFSERLKQGMKEKGLKAADLSRMSGVSESMISSYRSGRFEATQTNLQKLAETLDVSIPWLMGYDVPMGYYSLPAPRHKVDRIAAKLERLTESQLDIIEQITENFLGGVDK